MAEPHVYEVHPRKDHRGVDLISDVLPFGRLWYAEPNAVSNAILGTQSDEDERINKLVNAFVEQLVKS